MQTRKLYSRNGMMTGGKSKGKCMKKHVNKAGNWNTRKRKRHSKKRELKLHFYDDKLWNFYGMSFEPKQVMCTGRIVCKKVRDLEEENPRKGKIMRLLSIYTKRMTNPAMREYVRSYHATAYKNLSFHPHSGISDKQIKELCDPLLEPCMVAFDMDRTLHQTDFFVQTHTIGEFRERIARLTKSEISYEDIGEFYFGGAKRMALMRDMFQNLSKRIGMSNVYVVTRNHAWDLNKLLKELYSRIFGVNFLRRNIIVTKQDEYKYENIAKILERK
jgi:hypothetical protein